MYINLDRSVERRERVEAQLRQFGLLNRYRRFPAVDGRLAHQVPATCRPEEAGCFLSHYEIARQHVGSTSHLHVLEDDVLLCRRTVEVVQRFIKSGILNTHDILFTDNYLALQFDQIRRFKSMFDELVQQNGPIASDEFDRFELIDLKHVLFAGTASYVLSSRSIGKLHDLYADQLRRGLDLPIDLFLRKLVRQGKIRAVCVFPFVTSVRLEDIVETTTPGRYGGPEDLSVMAGNVLRHSFYIDCDWNKCRALVETIWRPRVLTEHEELILRIAQFTLFGNYNVF